MPPLFPLVRSRSSLLPDLLYFVRIKRTIARDDARSKIIVMVPCYSKGDRELREAVGSVVDTSASWTPRGREHRQ